MNILLLGSGGREHALAWKMAQSHHCNELYIAPGNAGTAQIGTNLPFGVNDFDAIKNCCIEKNINLLVIGPEDPLVNGIHDFLRSTEQLSRMIIVGPKKEGAQLEGSKAFSKHFMQRHKIPTAAYAEFTKDNFEEGKAYIQQHSLPVVLKADGLAAGKGVVIATTHEEALRTFEDMIIHQQFGAASNKVVIEQFLKGIELSVFVLTDGKDYQIIGHAKDYKRIGEGDTGLNTGGMGCVSPVPFADELFLKKVEAQVILPTIQGLQEENIEYTGILFLGLMKVGDEPFVIEYNCRFGDPETEVILPRLETDLVSMFAAMDNGTLADVNISYYEGYFATVMAVSGGYPGNYPKGKIISLPSDQIPSTIFHAGTTTNSNNAIITNGGRVLTATSVGESLQEAVNKSLQTLAQINFEGMYYRKDIGWEFQ